MLYAAIGYPVFGMLCYLVALFLCGREKPLWEILGESLLNAFCWPIIFVILMTSRIENES